MRDINLAYQEILKHGIVSIRNLARSGDAEACEIEADHLHNIPSLIGEENYRRHIYYLEKERARYVERMKAHQGAKPTERTVDVYVLQWTKLAKLLLEWKQQFEE